MTRLTVAVRVRPLSDRETTAKSVSIVSVENGKTVAVTNIKVPEQNAGDSRERVRRFTFDYCFGSDSTQDDVYQNIGKDVAKAIKRRFHSCILAYGQSSSGKTHTMIGDAGDAGLAPRLCQNIFEYLRETAAGSEAENLNATVSYLEIYNEKVRDLLEPVGGLDQGTTLKVREHPKKGPYVQGLSEKPVLDTEELLNYLSIGNANRTIAATNANRRSSRSHSVFTVTCRGGSKLRLVDLAGSERAGSRSHTTSRFREGANINKSLVALRNVISALADSSRYTRSTRKRFIPYRDSILTWLLKDTLGGNSKTILISTVSPSSTCYNETVNTLRFGQRAKQIIVQPLVNEDPKESTIRELRAEIAKLKELLASTIDVPAVGRKESLASEQDCPGWEEAEEFDSGITSSSASFDDDETSSADESASVNVVETRIFGEKVKTASTVVELIPVMDVTSEVDSSQGNPLRRTFSMDQKMDAGNARMFGSHEVLSSGIIDKVRKNPSFLRKRSVDRSMSSLLPKTSETPIKMEKGVATEGSSKAEVKSKIDSIRKPRSQIVAAVTHRLYNKVKKKEASTDTDDINQRSPKELKICSNARLRLQEISQRALRANRRKNVDTQTDLFPVLRVKEISTDVDDLKFAVEEVKHAEVETDCVDMKDSSTNCSFLETLNSDFKAGIVLTRTCGTSMEDDKPPTTISFTKYLQSHPQPKFEIINPCTANPIYTSAVNINVNHNYNIERLGDNSVSDDSLDEAPTQNVCFPDLISNHNSLEPHGYEAPKMTKDLRYSSMQILPDEFTSVSSDEFSVKSDVCNPNYSYEPHEMESVDSISWETLFAPLTCLEDDEEDYDIFYKLPPLYCKPKISFDRLHGPLRGTEPVVLKSIMKHQESSSDEESVMTDVPDSLNYYHEKKKVRFNESNVADEGMYQAMTNFMREVTTLMTNLTKVANKIETFPPTEQTYEMQLTVNDIKGLPRHKPKVRRKERHRRVYKEPELQTTQTQTMEMEEEFPVNKYESLVETSCDRLEKLVQRIEASASAAEELHKFPQPFSVNQDWHYRHNTMDDSSLDSNPAFSDYGSLPRRKRVSSCSPSGYLRQLTSMRKQIVESSREELMNEAQINM